MCCTFLWQHATWTLGRNTCHSCMGRNSLSACEASKAESRNYCGKQAQREAVLCSRSWFPSGFTEGGPSHSLRGAGPLSLLSTAKFGGTTGVDKSLMTFSPSLYSKTTTPGSSAIATTSIFPPSPNVSWWFNVDNTVPFLTKTGWGNWLFLVKSGPFSLKKKVRFL